MSEVGHARNVASFEQMVSVVTGLGGGYDPSNADIGLSKLNNKLTAGNTVMDEVLAKVAAYTNETNIRQNLYEPLDNLATDSVNYYESTGTEKNKIKDARGFVRKIRGKRAKAVPAPDPDLPVGTPPPVTHSSAQTSYTQRVEHLDGLIELFGEDPLYAPNETNLQLASMTAYSTSLKTATTNVINSITDRDKAKTDRNLVLYHEKTGMLTLADLVKKYVKGKYGASSPQYKQLASLKFRKYKI